MKKINIRESLLQFDKDTSCQYDLTSLYEACALDEKDKKQLVQYIDAKDIDATNRFLTNKATEHGFMESVSDDVSDDELASFGVEKETLTEDTDADTIEQKIKDKTFDALLKKYDEEFVHDYCEVQVGEVEGNIQVRVNAEVSYSDLEDLGTELTKVITEFDPHAYFEPECPGRLVAYVRKDQSEDIVDEAVLKEWTDKFNAVTSRKELFDVYNELVKVRDNINSGTLMAIYYLVDDKIDEFPEINESLNEEMTSWTDVYEKFTDIVRKNFPNTELINKEVEDLYNEHKGETMWDEAYYRWCQGDESLTEDTPEKYEFTYNEPEFNKFTVGGKDVPYTSHEEAKAHMKEDYPMESFIDELVEYMKGNDLYYSPYVNEEGNLVITVEDGDWKHEHLYLDRLIGKFFFNRGLIVDINSEVIESDELSDCYSAHHIYELKDLIFSMSISESLENTDTNSDDDLDEGVLSDIANVGKAVAKEVKNSKTFQKHVQSKVDKVKNSDAYKNISNAVKDTDSYKNVKQGIDTAKDVVKSNVADKNRKATDISFNVDGKDYRASELKYKLNGKEISADEVAKMNAFQRRKVEMEVPEGVKPIKEGVASATQINWDDDDDFTYDAEVWEDAMGVVSNKDFFAEGSDYTWVERVSSVETLDFDNWAVWSALNQDTGETEYFVVEEDTEFIDWGPVDTEQEAKEFLQSKVDEYNLDESLDNEVTIDDVADAFKVNGPHSRQDKIPEAIDTAFNIINIKDNMRPKSYKLDRVDDNIQFTWVTQEPFKLYDLMLFEKELIRAFTEIAKSVGYNKEFTVMYDVSDRDGEDHRANDIIINGSVYESLDEAWVMSLSDATKDLNDADKNGFYKVMDNITCDPSKCPLDQLENEVGEIAARYTDGNASPEYEGEDFADEEYSGSKIYNAILKLYGRENELTESKPLTEDDEDSNELPTIEDYIEDNHSNENVNYKECLFEPKGNGYNVKWVSKYDLSKNDVQEFCGLINKYYLLNNERGKQISGEIRSDRGSGTIWNFKFKVGSNSLSISQDNLQTFKSKFGYVPSDNDCEYVILAVCDNEYNDLYYAIRRYCFYDDVFKDLCTKHNLKNKNQLIDYVQNNREFVLETLYNNTKHIPNKIIIGNSIGKNINIDAEIEKVISDDGVSVTLDGRFSLQDIFKYKPELEETVNTVKEGPFNDGTSLNNDLPQQIETLIFLPGVIKIDEDGYLGARGIKHIYIADTVKQIGVNAFENCTNLEDITIPPSTTRIGWDSGYNYCEIADANFTVIGKKGSTAEKYANKLGYNFKEM